MVIHIYPEGLQNKSSISIRGAATGGTGGYVPPPPTLKSRGTSYVLVHPIFTTTFICISWSPYIHTIVPATLLSINDNDNDNNKNNDNDNNTNNDNINDNDNDNDTNTDNDNNNDR